MDGEDRRVAWPLADAGPPLDLPPDLASRFTAAPFRELADARDRRARIADLVAVEIVPRLVALQAAARLPEHPTTADIVELARLVLSPDERPATAYVAALRDRGLPVDMLFSELLEPAARRLGELWEEDKVDFIDVTLGVGRLQALLSVFNCTHHLATVSERRSVLMLTVPGEQHSFGIAMVEQFLDAGGWQVDSAREAPANLLARLVEGQWFAVAGIALSNRCNFDKVAAAIGTIRRHSRNRAIGIMVGGPAFSANPGLADEVGADGTAVDAPTAVILAQKLLDAAIVEGDGRSAA
jgi:MerR family transcriptional regulator, light-induced transcriptional regulator